MIGMLSHIRRRRRELRQSIDVQGAFEQWEESCVPSYVHRNPLAAYVSWCRLFVTSRLVDRFAPNPSRVLDFGSSVGELSHILRYSGEYEFVELDDASAGFLLSQNRRARRRNLDETPLGNYDVVFALDSLEHNEDYRRLLRELASRLAPQGALLLSGPTENRLYRLGRRIAGFGGHYHHTNIHDIECEAAKELDLVAERTVPFGIPLFRLSVWRRRSV